MGTNYYLENDVCSCCNRAKDTMHIGKSSMGWCFSLHVFTEEEDGPTNLEEWINMFSAIDTIIKNEYGDTISSTEMVSIICDRGSFVSPTKPKNDIWFKNNYAEPGPNGLTRSKIDGIHCIGHGTGTWDYITGEFS